MTDPVFHGRCYCGQARITVTGMPRVSGYCHCQSCRRWHAAPITAWCSWPTDVVRIEGETITTKHDPVSQRVSCAVCGGGLANHKPEWNVSVVYVALLEGFEFRPTHHVHYGERVLDVADGLPKYVDLPGKLGGSEEMVPEPALTGISSSGA